MLLTSFRIINTPPSTAFQVKLDRVSTQEIDLHSTGLIHKVQQRQATLAHTNYRIRTHLPDGRNLLFTKVVVQGLDPSSPRSHFLVVNFLCLGLGVFATGFSSRLIPFSLKTVFSTSLFSSDNAGALKAFVFVRVFLLGDRLCSSRSRASTFRRKAAFSSSRSWSRSEAVGEGSSWT